ncbi:hypothetical protein [Singulisphaera sp. PoT]|uniref:hypothetical protein n=1 Tax=Singulisphaera sp. PoT TaxID=3411797 RepID=UPI003BF52CB7
MNIALGLVTLALLGADGSPKVARPIQYHVRVLEMNGLEWREATYSKLTPVAKQGNATVWTVDAEAAQAIAERAGRVVMSPQVMTQSEAVAHFSNRTTRRVVSKLTRLADGPFDHAVAVAYSPDFEDVRDGCQFTFTGRKLDQGVLTKVVVEETQVAAVHKVKFTEIIPSQDGKAEPGKITPHIEIPEISNASVAGEWLIPNNGLLLVSFGVHTADDGQGRAIARERLMLIDADESETTTKAVLEPIPAPKVFTTSIKPPVTIQTPAISPPAPIADEAAVNPPALPSRTMPQGKAPEGSSIPLPPLPDEPEPPTSMPDSSEPCATPQTRPRSAEKTVDPASTKASFLPDPSSFIIPDAATRFLLSSLKPLLFKVPLSAGVTIEIRASMNPLLKP